MRAERVAEEVEAFLSGVSQRSFRLVDSQPELGHHSLRPRYGHCRSTAAENNEFVSIGDDVSMERVAASGQTPMLQEPVHVDVGQQWTCDAALRLAPRVSVAAAHVPGSIRVPFLDRRPQPHLDEAQDVSIHDTPGYRLYQLGMRNRIEVLGQIGINYISVTPA